MSLVCTFGGTQGDVRTSSLELRPGGSRVGETGGQWPLPSSPSAESGTLVILCGSRLEWKVASPPKVGVVTLTSIYFCRRDFGSSGS